MGLLCSSSVGITRNKFVIIHVFYITQHVKLRKAARLKLQRSCLPFPEGSTSINDVHLRIQSLPITPTRAPGGRPKAPVKILSPKCTIFRTRIHSNFEKFFDLDQVAVTKFVSMLRARASSQQRCGLMAYRLIGI